MSLHEHEATFGFLGLKGNLKAGDAHIAGGFISTAGSHTEVSKYDESGNKVSEPLFSSLFPQTYMQCKSMK